MKIIITHNAITRLIFETLLRLDETSTFLRIETRPEKLEKAKRYNLLYANCNSIQSPE